LIARYIIVKNKSILLKSVACGSIYLLFLPLLIFIVYTLDFFEGAFFVGGSCGVVIVAAEPRLRG
jgi:hypothetical protein